MEKRLIVAMVLSLLIIMAFQHLFGKPVPVTPKPSPRHADMATPITKEMEIKERSQKPEFPDEKLAGVETDKYILTFSDIGGSIKSISLKDFKGTSSGGIFTLADIQNPKEYILSLDDPMGGLFPAAAPWEISVKNDAVFCTLRTKDFEVVKKFVLDNSNYGMELQLFVKNISDSPKPFSYKLISGAGLVEKHIQDKRFLEANQKINGKILRYKNPRDKIILNLGSVDWLALKSKYFSMVLKPLTGARGTFYYESKNGFLVAGLESEDATIPPGSFIEHRFLLYAGPAQPPAMANVLPEFQETINYGFFGFISTFLLALMRFFYRMFNSWGVSIIFLSIFLNIVLFPLSLKSFKSMKKMQDLHPHMEKLKAQYKDNPQKLNKEIMELYKKYNINPLSGCLPLILQMPIFIALYSALSRSIELRSASFLWIKDLSGPEAIPIPFTLPLIGNTINILPLAMVFAMVLQQKISSKSMGGAVTEEQKQQQKMMLIIMPVMFGFIFYNMPSGLVLYWLLNTVLTLVEQSVIFKKI